MLDDQLESSPTLQLQLQQLREYLRPGTYIYIGESLRTHPKDNGPR